MNVIGKGTQIHETALIGVRPLSLKRDEIGDYVHKESNQGVIIGDYSTIGPYTVIKSGHKNPTILQDHVHVCEFVNIGHDCKVGRNTMIMPHVVLNGHVEVGEETIIYGGVLVRNRVKIGSHCIIGMGSIVVKDVPDKTFGYGQPFKARERKLSWNNLKLKARMRGWPI